MLSYTRNTVYIFYTLAGARHSWLADPSIEVQGLLRHELHYVISTNTTNRNQGGGTFGKVVHNAGRNP